MKKMFSQVLQKESDINNATWKNNTQNSGNILNVSLSSNPLQNIYIYENNTLQLKRNWKILVLKLKLAPEMSLF